MQYRINPKNNERISALGFGCMRFHKDEAEVERQLRHAIAQGVNYFDTAYIYAGSEALLGKILAKDGLRAKVNIATKLPLVMTRKRTDFDKYFNTELERLQTDYIDYYMMHMLTDLSSWQTLCGMGIMEWIAEKKRSGQIRNIGFSFHGVQPEFMAILDAYDWDFCMIQYNYLDAQVQAGTAGLDYAAAKGIAVFIMEPLRGGTLVNSLPKQALALWDGAPQRRTPADWGLRWVLNHRQVTCVLSGMGSMQMVEENIAVACEAQPGMLRQDELMLYDKVSAAIRAATVVPCTGCGYCMPCPRGVDIPMTFASLNDTKIRGSLNAKYWHILMAEGRGPSLCSGCGACERHCPQAIPIRDTMRQAKKRIEGFPYGIMRVVMKRVLNRRKK